MKIAILFLMILMIPAIYAGNICTQQQANESAGCGDLANIINPYKTTGSWWDNGESGYRIYDNIYTTYGKAGFGGGTFYVNYTTPLWILDGSYLSVKMFGWPAPDYYNFTIPSNCINYKDTLEIKIDITNDLIEDPLRGNNSVYCLNTTGWNLLFTEMVDDQSADCRLYEEAINWNITPSINVSFISIDTNNIINDRNITYQIIQDDFIYQSSTATGEYLYTDLSGTYTLTGTAENFTKSYYTVTVGLTDQNIVIYLGSGTETTTFSIRDSDTSDPIENALVSIRSIVGGEMVLVNSLTSDISGSVSVPNEVDEAYYFNVTKDGYLPKEFTLNPISFDSYNVWLDPINVLSYDFDYSGLYFDYTPKRAYNNATNEFTFTILSPIAELSTYNFNVSYNGGSNYSSGSSTTGGDLYANLTVTGAEYGDKVKLIYSYQKIDGEEKTFTQYIEIYNITSDANTWEGNRGNHYGLGLFERILIITLIVIIVAGMISYFASEGAGAVVALMIYAFFWAIEFVNSWVIVISVIMLFIITLWRGRT